MRRSAIVAANRSKGLDHRGRRRPLRRGNGISRVLLGILSALFCVARAALKAPHKMPTAAPKRADSTVQHVSLTLSEKTTKACGRDPLTEASQSSKAIATSGRRSCLRTKRASRSRAHPNHCTRGRSSRLPHGPLRLCPSRR